MKKSLFDNFFQHGAFNSPFFLRFIHLKTSTVPSGRGLVLKIVVKTVDMGKDESGKKWQKNCQSLQISTEMDSLLPHACSCYTFTFYLFEEKKRYNDFTLSLKKTSKCTLKGLSLLRGRSKVRGQTRGRGVREMSTLLIKQNGQSRGKGVKKVQNLVNIVFERPLKSGSMT